MRQDPALVALKFCFYLLVRLFTSLQNPSLAFTDICPHLSAYFHAGTTMVKLSKKEQTA